MSDVCYPSDKLSTQEPMSPVTTYRQVRAGWGKCIWDKRKSYSCRGWGRHYQ